MSATVIPLQLCDDNPSAVDLLGLSDVVSPIVEAIGTPTVDPLAIGVHSPWGGGKSTILNLLDDRLEQRGGFVVVRTDPWQYDNHYSGARSVRHGLVGRTPGSGEALAMSLHDRMRRAQASRGVGEVGDDVLVFGFGREEGLDLR